MKVLAVLAVCLVAAQAASTNYYQPISFQPNQEPIPINPSLPAIQPLPAPEEGPIYHEINVPHYEGAPMVIIKVNVQRAVQPEPEPEMPVFQTLPAILPPEFFNPAPFNPADLAKPTPAFNPADLAKAVPVFNPAELLDPLEPQTFNPQELVKPLEQPAFNPSELVKPNLEGPTHEFQAGPLVKILVNIEN